MRTGRIALFVISCCAVQGYALNSASPADRNAIQALIDSANQYAPKIAAANKAFADAVHDHQTALNENRIDDANRLITAVEEADQAIFDLERERNLIRDKAIHRTLIAYEIVPAGDSTEPEMPSGQSVMAGPYKGQTISWVPIADDNKERPVLLPNGKIEIIPKIKLKPGQDSGGRTHGDGVTTILPFAFQSPEFLAVTLAHEKYHFEQYTTPGSGDTMSYNDREVAAWTKSISDFKKAGFSAEDQKEWMIRATATLRSYIKKVNRERSINGRLARVIGKEDSEFSPNDPQERDHLEARFDELSKIVAKEIHEERAISERRKAEPADYPQIQSSDSALAASLRDIAVKACHDPEIVGVGEVENLPSPNNPDFYRDQIPEGLGSGCALSLYLYLVTPMESGRRPTRATIREFVHSYFNVPAAVLPPASPLRAPPPLSGVPPPPMDNYKQVRGIRALAVKACETPDGILREDFFEAGLLNSLGEVYGAADVGKNLSGCPRFVFDRIIEFYRAGKTINQNVLTQWAAQSRIVPVSPRRGNRETPEPHNRECTGGEDYYHPRMCPGG